MFFIPRSRGFSPSFAMFDIRWQPPLYPLICALRSKWLRLECGGLPDETKGFAMWKCSIVFFGGSKQYHVLVALNMFNLECECIYAFCGI